MSKRIIYWVTQYQPEKEGVSKEVKILYSHFKNSFIHNLSAKVEISYERRVLSYHNRFYPLVTLIPLLETRSLLSHIFCPAGPVGFFYLTILRRKPIVLTWLSKFPETKIVQNLRKIKNVNKIVVEAKGDMEVFLSLGVDDDSISLIYPGINLNDFNYSEPTNKEFKILFASAPFEKEHFYARGVNLILDSSKNMEDTQFILLWRQKYIRKLKQELDIREIKNIQIINRTIQNMNNMLGQVHATITPFVTETGNKSCPISIVESLAAGKPVLVSTKVGIADVIRKERCGVIFEPTKEGLNKGITKLKRNYTSYQKKSRECCEEYFSQEQFVKSYENLYKSQILG